MSKKIFGLVALFAAVALFAGANTVKAATAEELQAQINALLAQIGSLQGGSTMTSCYSFTRDLTIGSTGADVGALQAYLGTQGYFTVTPTSYFGPITASAVAKWQATAGITPAAGYFGPISRAKYNSMCSSTPSTPSTGDDDDDDDDDFSSGNGEEASLEDFDARDGDDTDAEEGASEQAIMEIEFDVEDSDVEVQRVEVTFSPDSGNEEMDPWDVFEGATLWMDGEEVATAEDLDDEDNWDEESGDDFSFRFNGVDTVVDMGDKAKFVVSVDVQDGVDGVDTGDANWDVFIDGPANGGIRALDEAGIDQYTGDDSDIVTVSIEEAGEDNELNLSESDDNPDAMTLEVDEDDKSDWQSLGLMTLKADGDIELRDFKFQTLINENVSPADEVYSDVVNDLMLVIDGEEYDDFSVANASTATATITFDLDDEDVVIEDGDEVEVEVMAEFKALTGNYDEGTTVTVNASSGLFETIDAEGVEDGEDLGTDQLEGSFEGETNTLRSQGFSVDFVDANEESPVGSVESRADYGIEFSVTAFGDDFFIPRTTTRSASASSTVGVTYVIEEDDGDPYTSGTTSASFSVASSVSGDTSSYFKVSEGQTRTFKLNVSLNNLNQTTGYYRLQMVGVAFDTDTVAGGTDTVDSDELDEFDTDTVQVQNANVD